MKLHGFQKCSLTHSSPFNPLSSSFMKFIYIQFCERQTFCSSFLFKQSKFSVFFRCIQKSCTSFFAHEFRNIHKLSETFIKIPKYFCFLFKIIMGLSYYKRLRIIQIFEEIGFQKKRLLLTSEISKRERIDVSVKSIKIIVHNWIKNSLQFIIFL
jgi:hypothetical protein